MQEVQKQIIKFALDYDVENIHSYSGYKGDLIVKICSKQKEVMLEIRRFALSLDVLDVVIKQNPNMLQYEIYCVTEDADVYELKF